MKLFPLRALLFGFKIALEMWETMAFPKAQALEGLRAANLAGSQKQLCRQGWCRRRWGRPLGVVCSQRGQQKGSDVWGALPMTPPIPAPLSQVLGLRGASRTTCTHREALV